MTAYFAVTLLFLQITVGATFAVLARDLAGGAWGEKFIAALERIARVTPLASLAFLVNLAALTSLFAWPEHREILKGHAQKLAMTPLAFSVRTIIVLAIFTAASFIAKKPNPARPLKCAALISLFFAATVGAFDWFFDPNFVSSIEGVAFLGGGFVGALALALLKAPGQETKPYLKGNLLFTGCCAWAYLALSRLMVIYMGFEPEKLGHLTVRAEGFYKPVTFALWFLQWVIPFLILFFRPLKRLPVVLVTLSLGVLAARVLDMGDTLLLQPSMFALAAVAWLLVSAAMWRFA